MAASHWQRLKPNQSKAEPRNVRTACRWCYLILILEGSEVPSTPLGLLLHCSNAFSFTSDNTCPAGYCVYFWRPIASHSKIDNWSTETLTDIVFAYKRSYCCVVVRCPLGEIGVLGLQAPPERMIPAVNPNTAPLPASLWPCDKPSPPPPLSPQPFWFTAKMYFIVVFFGISLIDMPSA